MQDISFKVMAAHLVRISYAIIRISYAITDARQDLIVLGMTGINSNMYAYLKKAQNDIDVLREALRPCSYTTVAGEEAHGYTLAGYKVGRAFYGHANFGHAECGKDIGERISIPLEEFEQFLYEIPLDTRCTACGGNLLPQGGKKRY